MSCAFFKTFTHSLKISEPVRKKCTTPLVCTEKSVQTYLQYGGGVGTVPSARQHGQPRMHRYSDAQKYVFSVELFLVVKLLIRKRSAEGNGGRLN